MTTKYNGRERRADSLPSLRKLGGIVSGGKSEYKIVYPAKASFAVQFAVTELQDFIKEATGATIPAIQDIFIKLSSDTKIISVGKTEQLKQTELNTDYAALNGDGFFLKTRGQALFIDGASERGVIYGAYEFLERFVGVRFLSYENTYVPKTDALTLYETDITEIPDFKYRATGYSPTLSKMVYVQLYTHFDDRFAVRKRCLYDNAGITPEHGGAIEWYPKIGSSHNVFEYVDPARYFAEHPEMFAYNQGEEPHDICLTSGLTEDGRLDQSVPVSTLKTALESLKGFINDADPSVRFYMFGQNDNISPCGCEKCKAAEKLYGRSGMTVRFCNVLAEEGQKWADTHASGKEVNIVHFAYTYNEIAPVDGGYKPLDPTCKPKPNVVVYLAPIYSDYYLSYGDQRQPDSVSRIFRSWRAVHNRFFVWSYHSDFYNNFWYFPAWRAYSEQLKFLKEFGAEYVFMQTCANDLTNSAEPLHAYIAYKLMWNTRADAKLLRDEYLELYYGADAASVMTEYYDTFDAHIERQVRDNGLRFTAMGAFPQRTAHYDAKFYPYGFLAERLALIDKAAAAVKADPELNEKRRAAASLMLRRAKLIPAYMILHNYSVYFPGQDEKRKEFAAEFFRECDGLGVRMYKENGYIEKMKEEFLQ
jgi:hypothetical protein